MRAVSLRGQKARSADAPIPGVGDVWEKIYTTPALWHFHFVNSPMALELVNGRERIFPSTSGSHSAAT